MLPRCAAAARAIHGPGELRFATRLVTLWRLWFAGPALARATQAARGRHLGAADPAQRPHCAGVASGAATPAPHPGVLSGLQRLARESRWHRAAPSPRQVAPGASTAGDSSRVGVVAPAGQGIVAPGGHGIAALWRGQRTLRSPGTATAQRLERVGTLPLQPRAPATLLARAPFHNSRLLHGHRSIAAVQAARSERARSHGAAHASGQASGRFGEASIAPSAHSIAWLAAEGMGLVGASGSPGSRLARRTGDAEHTRDTAKALSPPRAELAFARRGSKTQPEEARSVAAPLAAQGSGLPPPASLSPIKSVSSAPSTAPRLVASRESRAYFPSDAAALDRLAEDVMGRIERKLRIERQRRGI